METNTPLVETPVQKKVTEPVVNTDPVIQKPNHSKRNIIIIILTVLFLLTFGILALVSIYLLPKLNSTPTVIPTVTPSPTVVVSKAPAGSDNTQMSSAVLNSDGSTTLTAYLMWNKVTLNYTGGDTTWAVDTNNYPSLSVKGGGYELNIGPMSAGDPISMSYLGKVAVIDSTINGLERYPSATDGSVWLYANDESSSACTDIYPTPNTIQPPCGQGQILKGSAGLTASCTGDAQTCDSIMKTVDVVSTEL